MAIPQNSWRAIAICATGFALFSMSPYSISQNGNGNSNAGGGNKLDDIIARLDRIESVVGCPVDDFIAGTCQHNPAGTSVSFCISQGFGVELAGGWDAEFYAAGKAGARWDIAALGDVDGTVEFPLNYVPTEISAGGSAGIGRGLDICIDVPLQAAADDEARLDDLVKGMNAEPNVFDRSKFQRRLLRAIRYAERRTPAPSSPSAVTADTRSVGDDAEFDRLDDAVDRFLAGEFLAPRNEPFQIFRDPIIADLRSSLDLPTPLQDVLDDPDSLFGALPTLGSGQSICDATGISGPIAQRFPNVATLCERLDSLPSYEVTSTAFETVHRINSLMADLPDEIIFGVGDILPDVESGNLPTPRPPGSQVCAIFPRLCR